MACQRLPHDLRQPAPAPPPGRLARPGAIAASPVRQERLRNLAALFAPILRPVCPLCRSRRQTPPAGICRLEIARNSFGLNCSPTDIVINLPCLPGGGTTDRHRRLNLWCLSWSPDLWSSLSWNLSPGRWKVARVVPVTLMRGGMRCITGVYGLSVTLSVCLSQSDTDVPDVSGNCRFWFWRVWRCLHAIYR